MNKQWQTSVINATRHYSAVCRINITLTARVVKHESDERRKARVVESRIKSRQPSIRNSDTRQIAFDRGITRNTVFRLAISSWIPTRNSAPRFGLYDCLFSHCSIFYTNIARRYIGLSRNVLVDREMCRLSSAVIDILRCNFSDITLFLQLQIPIKLRITIMWTACRKVFPSPGQRRSTRIYPSTGSKRHLTRLV